MKDSDIIERIEKSDPKKLKKCLIDELNSQAKLAKEYDARWWNGYRSCLNSALKRIEKKDEYKNKNTFERTYELFNTILSDIRYITKKEKSVETKKWIKNKNRNRKRIVCLHNSEKVYTNFSKIKEMFPDIPSEFESEYDKMVICEDCGRVHGSISTAL